MPYFVLNTPIKHASENPAPKRMRKLGSIGTNESFMLALPCRNAARHSFLACRLGGGMREAAAAKLLIRSTKVAL